MARHHPDRRHRVGLRLSRIDLLTSPDRGATWQVKKTGQTLPLSAMHFVDQSRGWATGPLGLMLATRDAGQTWYAQRQRARRGRTGYQ